VILVAGVYGSVARREDTELSDLDVIIITKNNSRRGKFYKNPKKSEWKNVKDLYDFL
jgi:predicted nucleotidyltransferase